MKLSRRLILRLAFELYNEHGKFTQYDLYNKMEEYLGRDLTVNEKRRVAMILRSEFVQEEIKLDMREGRRYIWFIL